MFCIGLAFLVFADESKHRWSVAVLSLSLFFPHRNGHDRSEAPTETKTSKTQKTYTRNGHIEGHFNLGALGAECCGAACTCLAPKCQSFVTSNGRIGEPVLQFLFCLPLRIRLFSDCMVALVALYREYEYEYDMLTNIERCRHSTHCNLSECRRASECIARAAESLIAGTAVSIRCAGSATECASRPSRCQSLELVTFGSG